MIGRGLIANPGLVREIQTGEKMQKEELHVFLRELKVAYQACMPDQPVLFKMKEIWSYLVNWYPNGKKVWKKVRKTNRLIEYDKLMLMLESGNEVYCSMWIRRWLDIWEKKRQHLSVLRQR